MTYKQVAIKAARQAGKILKQNFHKQNRRSLKLKGAHDILSKLDIAANNTILKTIKELFPTHRFLSEETGVENNSDFTWVIDPLDGTTNYVVNSPFFCTAIALLRKKIPILCVIYAPMLKQLYTAEQGRGACLNNKKIRVSSENQLNRAIISYGYTHHKKSRKNGIPIVERLHDKCLNTRMFHSIILDLAFVASGRLEGGYISPPVELHDSVHGVLLVNEAGGKVTDITGNLWTIKSKGVVASNDKIHNKLIRIINK